MGSDKVFDVVELSKLAETWGHTKTDTLVGEKFREAREKYGSVMLGTMFRIAGALEEISGRLERIESTFFRIPSQELARHRLSELREMKVEMCLALFAGKVKDEGLMTKLQRRLIRLSHRDSLPRSPGGVSWKSMRPLLGKSLADKLEPLIAGTQQPEGEGNAGNG